MADFDFGLTRYQTMSGPSLLSSKRQTESSFVSFSDWLDQFPNASEIRRRMSTDPIVRSKMMNAYIQNNPRSAWITASAADNARRSEESPYERTMRLARDYESYKSKASLIPNNPFIMSPEEFAREDARRVADRIQRARQVTRSEYVQDKPEFKGAKAGEEKVKVPVGPNGELQIERAGRDSTKFRMLPKSEVEKLIMEKRKDIFAAGQQDINEMKLEEARKMQQADPALREQTARLRGFEESEKLRGESEKVRNERSKLDAILRQNPGILQNPEYSSLISEAYSSVNAGVPAEMAARDLVGTGKLPEIREGRQRERERLREAARSELARTERDFKVNFYQWKAGIDQSIRDAESRGDAQSAAMEAQKAYDDIRAHAGALQRGIEALRIKMSGAKEEKEKINIESQIQPLQAELDDARLSMSYYMSRRDAPPPTPTQVPALSGYGGGQLTPQVESPQQSRTGGTVSFSFKGRTYEVTQQEWDGMSQAQKSMVTVLR